MKKSSILMMLMALFMSVTSFAQGIKGTVIDENGEPVIGATVAERVIKKMLPSPTLMVTSRLTSMRVRLFRLPTSVTRHRKQPLKTA